MWVMTRENWVRSVTHSLVLARNDVIGRTSPIFRPTARWSRTGLNAAVGAIFNFKKTYRAYGSARILRLSWDTCGAKKTVVDTKLCLIGS